MTQFFNRLFTVVGLTDGPSYQNASGPFKDGPLEPMDLAMVLTMVLVDGPPSDGPADGPADGPGRWTWEMDLGDGPNVDGDLNSNDSNYNASTEDEVCRGERNPSFCP